MQPQSCADTYGLRVDDILVLPSMNTRMLSRIMMNHPSLLQSSSSGLCHGITRGWFLEKCQHLPLSFHVYRKYGGNDAVDHFVRPICSSRLVLESIHYSIHRFVMRVENNEEPSLGFSMNQKQIGTYNLTIVSTVERASLAWKYGLQSKDIICRPTTQGRILYNVGPWIHSKMESISHHAKPLIFEVVRIHKVRGNEVPLRQKNTTMISRSIPSSLPPQQQQQQRERMPSTNGSNGMTPLLNSLMNECN